MLAKDNTTPDVSEIVIALLADLGFDSFDETDDDVKAYAPADDYDVEGLLELVKERPELITSIDTRRFKNENWNKMWESNFPMAEIAGRIVVYAPFHKNVPDCQFKICIMPQMAFGTGHHNTTSLMLELMLDLDVSGKTVLDMGCGTGILAIFAAIKGAYAVTAIDIDEWAYLNCVENCRLNNIHSVKILQGDSNLLQGCNFDIITANITRNVLTADMATYSRCLLPNGMLLLSGFYQSDFAEVKAATEKNGLILQNSSQKGNWIAAAFRKK